MATSKQRIQAYIDQQLFESFEAERVEWNLSQSQALERILAERYQAEKRSLATGANSDRLKWLEDKLIDRTWLNNRSFDEIFNRLGTLEDIVSQLFRKLDSELPTSDLTSESNSELLVSDLSSESNSELPTSNLSSESNSELLVSGLDGESNSELLVSGLDGESNSESVGELPILGYLSESNSKSSSESPVDDSSDSLD